MSRAVEHAVDLHDDHLVLGRWRPLRPLGSGGSGSVWLARDEETARDVALKVVPREGKAGSRAEREVEAATRLRHPRCLRALALERDERHVYVAYEYVHGKTLHQALRAGELDDGAAVEMAAQLLDALAHAHGKGVIHRDVKPSNVMLEDSDRVSVRVLDFGLARIEAASTLTAAGDVPGTLSYIAPERLDGEEASGAADVWGVGIVLWESLTGRHPFWAASPLETAKRVQAGAPPLATARPDLPRELCATVDRMLTLSPGKRPTAKEAAARLRMAWSRLSERPRAVTSRTTLLERAAPATLAALFAGASTWTMPFFPTGWPFLLGAIAALTALARPTAGLALALAVPVLPLGNVSLGLAIAYGVVALGWLALFAGDARSGLLVLLGPLLAPLGLLALIPVLVGRARGTVRRIALAAGALATGVAFAALTRSPLPLTGEAPPVGLGLAGSNRPEQAAQAVFSVFGSHPALSIEVLVLAAAAASAPHAARFGLWGVAGWGSLFLAAALVAPLGAVPAFPLALGVWVAAAALALPLLRNAG